jgi:hypothetical protein
MIANPKRLSANSARKARRLHADGKVRYLPNARVYTVQGDHAPYIVVADGDQLTCNCPHHGTCSHMAAVRIARRDGERSATVLPISVPTST